MISSYYTESTVGAYTASWSVTGRLPYRVSWSGETWWSFTSGPPLGHDWQLIYSKARSRSILGDDARVEYDANTQESNPIGRRVRTPHDVSNEIYGNGRWSGRSRLLKHGRNQTGEVGPCESDCRKCELEAERRMLAQ